jgi:hypothetical protein
VTARGIDTANDNGGYVRNYYKVPAHLQTPVAVDGDPGVIVGFNGAYLMVLFEGAELPVPVHPTWHVEYPQAVAS